MDEKKGEEKVYKWGIAGCGKISKDFATCLLKYSRAKIIACAARDQDDANNFAKLYNIPLENAYNSYDKLYSNKNIDIVYVGTIHPSHKEIVINCLNNNKHIICEKPMGMNANEVKEMIKCAQKNKKLLLEAMWTRFFPAIKQVREWLDNDLIGDIISYQGNLSLKMPSCEQVPRLWEKKLGGGVILDLGVYVAAPLTMLFGNNMPKQIKAVGVLDKKHEIDIISSATILYNDTQYASINCDFLSLGKKEFDILGNKGKIRVEDSCHAPEQVTLYRCNDSGQICEKITKTFKLPKGYKYDFNFSNSHGLIYEIEGVTKALDLGLLECSEYTLNETIIVHQIMDEWRKQVGVIYPQDSE